MVQKVLLFLNAAKRYEASNYVFELCSPESMLVTSKKDKKCILIRKGEDSSEQEQIFDEIRVCKHCGRLMQQGFVQFDGDDYACEECFPAIQEKEKLIGIDASESDYSEFSGCYACPDLSDSGWFYTEWY